ncbi:MAG TPA: phosphagen kinase [Candidatus Paceibacterota bacterium]|nr:phosphagen kinase [Candidatus Paceibacterota bacterium]
MSLLDKYLTPEVEQQLKGLTTSHGVTLDDIIRSGRENPESSIGVYAGDAEAYTLFAPLFDPIIEDYHQHSLKEVHPRDFDPAHLSVTNLDPSGERIRSTRIRVGRNAAAYAFPPAISKEDRLELTQKVVAALESLEGDLAGTYYPLEGMDKATQDQLIADHFLFKEGDKYLESAGINRDWPEGRGIFHSADKKFLVWVNEEDGLRIISMEMGADLESIFDRLSRAASAIQEKIPFAYDEHRGYLTSCPTNLGTGLRASYMAALPKLSQQPDFKETCKSLGLQARGIHGEHSESEGGMFDISPTQRLGLTEVEAVQKLHDGMKKLFELEDELAEAA